MTQSSDVCVQTCSAGHLRKCSELDQLEGCPVLLLGIVVCEVLALYSYKFEMLYASHDIKTVVLVPHSSEDHLFSDCIPTELKM